MEIKILRSASCIEGDTCPMIARADNNREWLHLVVVAETEPEMLAAFAPYMGPGEVLGRFPAAQLPEVG
jgi:RNA polymerase subunit RPABC4/transcription elongation factor Spt4